MPTGYGEDIPADFAERAVRLGGGEVSALAVAIPATGTAGHRYAQGTQSELVAPPLVWNTAFTFATVKDAKAAFKAFRDASALAPTWDQQRSDPPATVTYTATALSFPKIGDETLAVRLAGKRRDAEFGFENDFPSTDFVVWRNGAVVSTLLGQTVDTLTFAKRADGKVKTILVACPKPKHKKSKKN